MSLFKRRKAERTRRKAKGAMDGFLGPDQVYPDLPWDEAAALWVREMHKAVHAKNMPHDHGPDNNLPQGGLAGPGPSATARLLGLRP